MDMSTDLLAFIMVVLVLSVEPTLRCITEYGVALPRTNH